ncbi:MAG: NADH-quinone oxidoreductase subunit L [Ignavibacteriae bacterium]|nr:NADH-quinone oxidoreductase subunit L [Ignavibacteriota bacterium]NOG96610.1 NADH-quinone oxidoreductase subunit L [Ignavibacteriota bacterium]
MSEMSLISLSIITLFLPLIGFTVLIFFGKRFEKIYLFEVGILFAALIISILIAYFKLTAYINQDLIFAFTWIDFGVTPLIGEFSIDLGIKIDNITVLMLFVVNLISFLVHLYSIEYMKGDIRFTRYFAYLGIFTFSMLGIVLTHNILMMFMFWELVGLSSYLLIGFWYEKDSASDAGKKAFLVNRVGDIGMLIGILILFTNYHTFTFDEIYAQIAVGNLPFDSYAWLTASGILIFMGAVGKSAQFPLHVWLPDAMEGPTPVSALIHAATMVAAGVYLLVRIFVMLTADAMLVIAVIGAITALVSATIALTQNDIKKVLAYSTVSQLGYMVLSIGIGAYAFAFFHLMTHAFFKACLFLGSGSVIHAMHHEQDIREMGGLKKKLPITYYTFLISSLAISGVPLFSGFLSKDGILAGSLAFGNLTGHWLLPIIGFTVALMTAFYMFRLVLVTFHGKPRNQEKFDHAHESPKAMTIPLITLAALSIFIFYTPNPFNSEAGWVLSDWIRTPEQVVPNEVRFDFMKSDAATGQSEITHSQMYTDAAHHAHYPAMILSLVLAGIGILIAFMMYVWGKIDSEKLKTKYNSLYKFSLNKWYIDEFYDASFIAGTHKSAKILAWFDYNVVDGIVNGTAALGRFVSMLSGWFDTYVVDGLVNFFALLNGFLGLSLRRIQTGKVQTYVVFVVFSLLVLMFFFRPF